jgi:hypothetical protein
LLEIEFDHAWRGDVLDLTPSLAFALARLIAFIRVYPRPIIRRRPRLPMPFSNRNPVSLPQPMNGMPRSFQNFASASVRVCVPEHAVLQAAFADLIHCFDHFFVMKIARHSSEIDKSTVRPSHVHTRHRKQFVAALDRELGSRSAESP